MVPRPEQNAKLSILGRPKDLSPRRMQVLSDGFTNEHEEAIGPAADENSLNSTAQKQAALSYYTRQDQASMRTVSQHG